MDLGGRRRLVLLTAATLAVVALGSGTSQAAPPRFFGVHAAGPTAADFQRMAQGGVRLCRVQIDWAAIEPSPGSFSWDGMDQLVTDAARSGIELLPLLIGTPSWVSANTARPPIDSPEARAAWSDFVVQLVSRYGSNGSFWAQHPELPRDPIVVWQIWNEVNTRNFWGGKPSPKGYARFVGLTARAIHAADPAAKVILAGLIPFKSVAPGSVSGMRYLERLLKFSAVRKLSDGVAIHPYGKTPKAVLKWMLDTRNLLNSVRARRLPLWVTEFGWSTGGSDARKSPVGATPASQARRVARIYRLLAKHSKRLRLQTAVYFSFEDIAVAGDVWIGHMGLFGSDGQPKPAWYAYTRRAGGEP